MLESRLGVSTLALIPGIAMAGVAERASAQEIKWRMQSNLGAGEPGYEVAYCPV